MKEKLILFSQWLVKSPDNALVTLGLMVAR